MGLIDLQIDRHVKRNSRRGFGRCRFSFLLHYIQYLSIPLHANKQLRRHLPNPFLGYPCTQKFADRITTKGIGFSQHITIDEIYYIIFMDRKQSKIYKVIDRQIDRQIDTQTCTQIVASELTAEGCGGGFAWSLTWLLTPKHITPLNKSIHFFNKNNNKNLSCPMSMELANNRRFFSVHCCTGE